MAPRRQILGRTSDGTLVARIKPVLAQYCPVLDRTFSQQIVAPGRTQLDRPQVWTLVACLQPILAQYHQILVWTRG